MFELSRISVASALDNHICSSSYTQRYLHNGFPICYQSYISLFLSLSFTHSLPLTLYLLSSPLASALYLSNSLSHVISYTLHSLYIYLSLFHSCPSYSQRYLQLYLFLSLSLSHTLPLTLDLLESPLSLTHKLFLSHSLYIYLSLSYLTFLNTANIHIIAILS